jgi:spermidine/putrescine transport system ATP-binding protein
MLELKNISKMYEGRPLLKNISFTLHADEAICLLGASGSGKSTLLRMIAGLEFPDEGVILFNGMDLANTAPHLRDFGLVFQDYGLFPHLNIFDNIAFGLRMKKYASADIKERVATLLAQIGLSGFENRSVTDLSGGEQQRVALARALAPNPRLLMFDEPLGALDRTLKEDLLNELRDILHETKIPAIYVTHDQEEAFAIADRILLLHEGEIIRAGTPQEIWNDPGSSWAAKFFGIGNIIEGVVTASHKIKTEFGVLDPKCRHDHSITEKIPLLIRQTSTGGQEIKVRVEDVLFKREQFQVKSRGALFYVKERPKPGQVIHVRVKVECLHEDPKEKFKWGSGL